MVKRIFFTNYITPLFVCGFSLIPSLGYSDTKEVNTLTQDPAMKHKWGLKVIDSQKAWRISTGSKKVIVAIIDTGIDTSHPDLRKNLWRNPNEIPDNNIDDDNNGFIDDVYGWNFANNSPNVTDTHGHGTHIAGIIGAEGGNGIGLSGVAPAVSLMVLKYFDEKSSPFAHLKNTVKAIHYAIKMKANIINYSAGGLQQSAEEKAAIILAKEKGILFVAAAGNEQSNSDIHGFYPADYDLDNIISVTAINPAQQVLPSSNFGTRTVDIAAPGHKIYSTLNNRRYGYMTGTSQATAFVTGVAALLMSQNKKMKKPKEIIKHLVATGDSNNSLIGKTKYQVRLNSYRALAIKDDSNEPAEIPDSLDGILGFTNALQHHLDQRMPSNQL